MEEKDIDARSTATEPRFSRRFTTPTRTLNCSRSATDREEVDIDGIGVVRPVFNQKRKRRVGPVCITV